MPVMTATKFDVVPLTKHISACEIQKAQPTANFTSQPTALLSGPHSITSSARASRLSGTVRPSAFAVLRLITNSYFVGACTGRSAGFSPLKMRST